LKILFIHTYYAQKGGEDEFFCAECDLVRQVAEVQIATFQNRLGWRGAIQFLMSVWNVLAHRKLQRHMRLDKPDIIHLHNWHFAIGPIIIRAARKRKIPIVLTIHNYRLLCPSGTLSNKGKLFTDSMKSSFPWKAVGNKVYRNSRLQTFWLAFVVWFHRKIGTWKMVNKYIVLTEFSKSLFVGASVKIPMEKFVVKPNFLHPPQTTRMNVQDSALFVGRLCEEKGIKVLLKVFRIANYRLAVAGDGPLKEEVLNASKEHPNIHYLGNLTRGEVDQKMKDYQVLIFPSTWYEGMPLTIVEAFASGLPVISSNFGAMASMIQHGYNGLHFEVGNANDLLDKLNYWRSLPEKEKENFRFNAQATYLQNYTAQENLRQLLEIYDSVK
jgi:glycosyltransferase involved in cell wall biosynthesis